MRTVIRISPEKANLPYVALVARRISDRRIYVKDWKEALKIVKEVTE